MNDSDIERIKNEGARQALLDASSNALWQVKRAAEQASGDRFRRGQFHINEAKRQLKAAEEFYDAAKAIKAQS